MTSTQESALHRMIDTLEAVDRAALEGVFADDVRLRASLPSRDEERSGRAEAAELMLAWYRDSTDITRVHDVVDSVGDIWHAGWRFTLREAGAEFVVEQHAYCTVTDGLIGSIRVMCSGFRPAGYGVDVTLDSLGEGCAMLTPRIAAAMRGLAPGQVLAVRTDDPAAPEGIAAWSRLTGHEVVGAAAEPGGTRFLLRHR
jgi:TusA-related sulfurtransferase/ketosteroid isomerase-like protein